MKTAESILSGDNVTRAAVEERLLAESGYDESRCVFCEIISGRADCAALYEDETVISIMDKYPVAHGHVLVLLKRHCRNLGEMEPDEAKVLFEKVHLIARGTIKAMNVEGFNIGMNNGRCAGQTVAHVHVHIIPRYAGDDFWTTRRPQNIPVGTQKSNGELCATAAVIQKEVNRLLVKRLAKL